MKKVRWGIVGPGIIAHEFAHDFQFTKHAELTTVASNNKERGRQFAEKFAINKVYNTYDQIYNDPNIDAVYVATPHVFHRKNSADALLNGKAVLCEKPLTHTLNSTQELISVAKQTGTYLLEGMWTYFLPAIKTAQKWINEGRIGKVLHVNSNFGYKVKYDPDGRMYNPELAGGSLLDMGCYTIAMAWLFQQKSPDNIQVLAHKAATGVDDDVKMFFDYNGNVSTLHSAFRCKLHNWTYVIGEDGYIAIPDFWRAKECFLYENETIIEHFTDERKGFGFNFEIDAASIDILEGRKESEIVTHADSMEMAFQIDAVMKQF